MTRAVNNLRRKLAGGDRRSIGRANAVAAQAARSRVEFGELIAGLSDSDPIIRMRSADAAEKASRKNPTLLAEHRRQILSHLRKFSQQEVCWHIALMLPRLALTGAQALRAAAALLHWARTSESKIVIVNSLQGLWQISADHAALRPQTMQLLRECMLTGSAAVKARARKLMAS